MQIVQKLPAAHRTLMAPCPMDRGMNEVPCWREHTYLTSSPAGLHTAREPDGGGIRRERMPG